MRLLAQAELELERNPGLALALAVEGAHRQRGPAIDTLVQRILDALHEERTLLGHSQPVLCARFDAEGERVLTTSGDGTARLWDRATGTTVRVFEDPDQRIRIGVVGPNGRALVTRSSDGWFGTKLWDAQTGELRAKLVGALGAEFDPSGTHVLGACQGAVVTLWNASTGAEERVLEHHRGPATAARFSPDGAWIATASMDRTVHVLDAAGKPLHVLRGHRGGVLCVAFSADNARLVSGSDDRTARLWDRSTGAMLRTFGPHEHSVVDAQISGDGAFVLTAAANRPSSHTRILRVWDARSGRLVRKLEGDWGPASFAPRDSVLAAATGTRGGNVIEVREAGSGALLASLRGHDARIVDLSFSADGASIASCGEDQTARVWSLRSGLQRRTRTHARALSAAAVSADGTRMLTADDGGGVQLTRIADWHDPIPLESHEQAMWSVAFSPDGSKAVTASQDGNAIVWDLEAGLEEATLDLHGDTVTHAEFSPDGRRIVTASYDETAALWDAASGERVLSLEGHEGLLVGAWFTAGGRRILTAASDHSARLWDAETGRALCVLEGHTRALTTAVCSDDGRLVVTCSEDRATKIWDATTSTVLASLAEAGVIRCAGFDGSDKLWTGGADGKLRAWNARTGKLLAEPGRHAGAIVALQIDRATHRVLTASQDGTARIWDARSGELLRVLQGHSAGLSAAMFFAGGKRVLTASRDKTARIWPVDAVAAAIQRQPRPLSDAERQRFSLPERARAKSSK